MLFDFAAYFLILLASYTIESFYNRKGISIYLVLKYLFFSSGIILTLLYAISFFNLSIVGFPLRYNQYFSPLVNNLHQISMYIIPFPFIGFFLLEKESKLFLKLIIIILIILFFRMGIETGSFKALIGLYLAGIFYIYFKVIAIFKGTFKNIIIALSVICSLFLLIINYETISTLLFNVFQEEDISNGRANLYSNALKTGLNSPIVGLGTGPHILNGGNFWDAHQTLLTVFLQTGIIGLFIFSKLLTTIVLKLYRTPALLAATIPLLIYVLGGDVLRRLPVWLFFILFYYYVPEQKK